MQRTKIGKYIVNYTNAKEYHLIKQEIFTKGVYSFDTNSPSPYIIDVGAHIGIAVVFFKSEYPNSQILCIEPNPKAVEILNQNIFENGFENISILQKAVSSKVGKRPFYIDDSSDEWYSTASMKRNDWSGTGSTTAIDVECVLLSQYIDREVDILKIDIEGEEEAVLEEIYSKLSFVLNIVIEYHPKKGGNPSKIIESLSRSGFSCEVYHEGKKITKYPQDRLLIIRGARV